MDKNRLLAMLPPFNNEADLIKDDQSVTDIIDEVLAAHEFFKTDYDNIAQDFYESTTIDTCKEIFDFCKEHIAYKIESDKDQTSRSPSAILALGYGDCKHYSQFIAGILDALNRDGEKIKFCYRFASYKKSDKEPQHVFVVVRDGSKEIWIDPVLDYFNEREPEPDYFIDIKPMALHRLSGIDENDQYYSSIDDKELAPELVNAIQTLLYYGVMDLAGNIDTSFLAELQSELPSDRYNSIISALTYIEQRAAIGNIFGDIWHGVKKVALVVPRNAYIGLLRINAFGWATKLEKVISDPEGQARVKTLWVDKFSGTWGDLADAIHDGANQKAIMGIGVLPAAAAAPGALAAAAAIIAAIAPIITSILNKLHAQGDATAGMLLQTPVTPPTVSSGIMGWIQENPIIAAVGAFGVYKFLLEPMLNKKKRAV